MQTNLENTNEILFSELFALEQALRYQQWIIATIKPYLGDRILELGAGTGNMSQWFTAAKRLIITEGDRTLLPALEKKLKQTIPTACDLTIAQHNISHTDFACFANENINTIVSFNVIEHILDDVEVIQNCVALLRSHNKIEKKRIISFVPAHLWAYGTLDAAVGHYRRYNKQMLQQLHQKTFPEARLILKPFNFVGLWGWIVNGRILKRRVSGTALISVFEKLCPIIQLIDKILIEKLNIPIGQSLIAIQEWD